MLIKSRRLKETALFAVEILHASGFGDRGLFVK
jgi:hypothetical protein